MCGWAEESKSPPPPSLMAVLRPAPLRCCTPREGHLFALLGRREAWPRQRRPGLTHGLGLCYSPNYHYDFFTFMRGTHGSYPLLCACGFFKSNSVSSQKPSWLISGGAAGPFPTCKLPPPPRLDVLPGVCMMDTVYTSPRVFIYVTRSRHGITSRLLGERNALFMLCALCI